MENCFLFNHKKVSLLFLSLDKPRTFREKLDSFSKNTYRFQASTPRRGSRGGEMGEFSPPFFF